MAINTTTVVATVALKCLTMEAKVEAAMAKEAAMTTSKPETCVYELETITKVAPAADSPPR